MLALIGLGIDTKEISVKAAEFLKKSDITLLEEYTTPLPQAYKDYIDKLTDAKIVLIKRSDLEDKVRETVAQAKTKTVSILIPGDPLIATTHHIIIEEADKQKIKTKVFHSSSVFTAAIGESGLDVYKFGPTTTIPFWSERYKPTSFLDVVANNMQNKQHTLMLLDIEQKTPRPMKLEEALEIISSTQVKKEVLLPTTKIIIIGDIGRESQLIKYVEFGNAAKYTKEFAQKTLCIVVPSKPSFAEEEAMNRL